MSPHHHVVRHAHIRDEITQVTSRYVMSESGGDVATEVGYQHRCCLVEAKTRQVAIRVGCFVVIVPANPCDKMVGSSFFFFFFFAQVVCLLRAAYPPPVARYQQRYILLPHRQHALRCGGMPRGFTMRVDMSLMPFELLFPRIAAAAAVWFAVCLLLSAFLFYATLFREEKR